MKRTRALIILMLVTCTWVVPVMAEEEDAASLNTSEIPGCINGSPNRVGPQDMSYHSRYDPPFEVTQPSREELIKENPNIIFINTSDMPMDAKDVKVSSEEVLFNSDGTFTVIRAHNVTSPRTTPIPPGMNPWESLRGRHPNVERNAEIVEYINTCGLTTWHEERYNATCRYVYLVPGPSCTQKLVYLNKDVNEREDNDSIVWVRLIDRDEELPVEVPDPLAGLYSMYPETQENPAMMENGTTVQVYLIAENKTFRQLIATVEDTSITGVTVLEETDLAVNKTEALARAGQQVSPTTRCINTHLRLEDGKAVWFISYMDGPVYTAIEIDAGEIPASPEKLPGFSSGSAVGSILLLRMIRRRRGRRVTAP